MHRQIAPAERYRIARCRKAQGSIRTIAEFLDRAPSTISRELRHNRCERVGAYRPEIAQRGAQNRRHLGHQRRRFAVAEWDLVLAKLEEWWSPEEIADTFRAQGILRISHETIYRVIWRNLA